MAFGMYSALSRWGNIKLTHSGYIYVSASGSATGDRIVNVTDGIGSVVVTNRRAERVSLSLVDTLEEGLDVHSSIEVTFKPARASQLAMLAPTTWTADSPFAVVVEARDDFGKYLRRCMVCFRSSWWRLWAL